MTLENEPFITIVEPDLIGYAEKFASHQEQSHALYETAMLAIQANGGYLRIGHTDQSQVL